ncbi:FtsX-like permease family protein, partial [Acidobacteriota bacterium]
AVLLLLIACINFMNLSTARYLTRANEVGMRKVVGASRGQLIKQFLGESTLLTVLSLPVAVILYEFLRPVFSAVLGQSFNVSLRESPHVLLLVIGVAILTGFFAGSYPALYLSAFKPVQVFRSKLNSGKKGSRFRKILVVIQFTFSIILILMTVISIKQSNHNMDIDLGYDRTNVLAVTLTDVTRSKLDVFKNELETHNHIISVSASASLPIEWNQEILVQPEGAVQEEAFEMNDYIIDYGFIEMLDIGVVKGRSFSNDYSDGKSCMLNETAVLSLQWEDPIGKKLTIGERETTVIGVTKDFHFKTIYLEKISPAVLYLGKDELNYMLVKYSDSSTLPKILEFLKGKWDIIAPGLPFEQITLENVFHDVFQGDKTSEMSGILGSMAIFLSCLGLFGLSSFSVERRIKEIGIRKVLGASVSGIVRMLTKEFMRLVIIANIIAIPCAYFMMNAIIRFVYSYPTRIGVEIFVVTVVLSLVIAFLTVSSQTVKSALADPVNSLKFE